MNPTNALDPLDHWSVISKLLTLQIHIATTPPNALSFQHHKECSPPTSFSSNVAPINIGIPHGSILEQLGFIAYINIFFIPDVAHFIAYPHDTIRIVGDKK